METVAVWDLRVSASRSDDLVIASVASFARRVFARNGRTKIVGTKTGRRNRKNTKTEVNGARMLPPAVNPAEIMRNHLGMEIKIR